MRTRISKGKKKGKQYVIIKRNGRLYVIEEPKRKNRKTN